MDVGTPEVDYAGNLPAATRVAIAIGLEHQGKEKPRREGGTKFSAFEVAPEGAVGKQRSGSPGSVMDRLDAMEIFVATIEGGSLAAAAHRLGRSPATVTRAIALLEDQAGDRLLHGTTRTLKLTGLGLQQLDAFRTILAELAALTPQPSSKQLVAGTLVVTAPELFGHLKAMPMIETFLAAHPAASVRVLLLNRVVDLDEGGVAVAIRLAPLPDSRLAALRLGEVRRLICAAPAYPTETAGRHTRATSTLMNESVTMNLANANYGRSAYPDDLATERGPFRSGVD